MSQKSSVDRAEMAPAAQRVEEAVQDLRKIQADLGQEQAQLSGRWIGEAGSAFTIAQFGVVIQSSQETGQGTVQTNVNIIG
ncbi:WXG100 family type VII secretion target [Actinomadura soli]|uniref:WXG100 family type VII secretion target n=1 Tax=Actinomadura soli TaxID=2508997 RepID=A0A5C4J9I0_9ACTN|nr:WXG100 family type VII secretion target [Actinomadura soli]TMQ97811.1 WXG100 family type VII secretion target [Actinomadura soli]